MERLKQSLPDRPAAFFFSIFCCIFSDSVLYCFSFSIAYHFGAIAQLVARYIRIVEVRGSNPLSSTTNRDHPSWVVFFL